MKQLLVLFLCLPAYSQSMVVNTIKGDATAYPTSQIDNVVFTEETTEPDTKRSCKGSSTSPLWHHQDRTVVIVATRWEAPVLRTARALP